MTEVEDLELDSLMELLNDDCEDFEISLSSAIVPEQKRKYDIQTQSIVNSESNSQSKSLKETLFCLEPKDLNKNNMQDLSIENSDINLKSKISKTVFSFETKALKGNSSNGSEVHTGLTGSSDEEDRKYLNETGMSVKKKLAKAINYRHDYERKKIKTWKDEVKPTSTRNFRHEGQNFTTDSYSGIRIVNPLVSFDIMQQRMQGRKMIKMSFIRNCIKGGDIEGDWVTMGVVVKKLPPKTSKNGKTFSIWHMTDLHDCEKIASVFLFGAAHTDHWKTAVGTVIGILNPEIMPNKDKESELSISVNHPGKIMVMGTSKDFGHCKAQRKSGGSCTMIVNLSQCEYCIYHVKKEYKKFSGKRSELQASYSGREPGFKSRVLKGENFFYQGQTFSPLGKKPPKMAKSKDRITLSSLPLKRKAEAIETEERNKGIKKLTEIYGPEISKVASKNSEFINNQLAVPTVGSRNLLLHMMKDNPTKGGNMSVITPEQLRKLQQNSINRNRRNDSAILKNLMPELGKGINPGEGVALDFPLRRTQKSFTREDLAKLKAIKTVKDLGPIKKQNPNAVKKTPKPLDIEKLNTLESIEDNKKPTKETAVVRSKLGTIDLNSKRVQEILNRKSAHAYEIEMDEMMREAAYFDRLEKKEALELKMASTTEIVCDVISCRQCKYTAHTAADRCKMDNHPLKCHKAIKRFYVCKDCDNRTFCFTQFPTKACRNCRGSKFERTGMWKARSGPKTDSEILNICSDDALFLNSL